jgi:hypothetical protein
LEDLLLGGGAFSLSFVKRALPSAAASGGFIPVNAGMIGSQLFDNVGSATQQGEPIPCGVIGGSSKWMGFLVGTNAVMMLDTVGSSFDTVLAVYVGSSFASLSYVACDNNSAPDGIRSNVRFPTLAGTGYLVAVDGVNGAQGNVSLNWRLSGPPVGFSNSSNRTLHLGDSAVLAVNLNNPTADTLYLWRLNGSAISVTGTGELLLPNMQLAQAGTYSVVVSNFAGMTNLEVATLKVAAPIQITGTTLQTNDVRIFRLTGPSSDGWIIEGATSLSEPWLPIWTNSSGTAPIDFIDFNSTNLPRRFYRVVPP